MKQNDKAILCVHKDTLFVASAPCGKPAITRIPHGFLCQEHLDAHERSLEQARQARIVRKYRDMDSELVQGIIATDRKAIAAGKRVRVRFGSLDPSYVEYLEPITVH